MKKILLIFLFFSFSLFNSQLKIVEDNTPKLIEVGRIAPLGMLSISLSKTEDNSIYCFDYRDIKFKHINEWKKFCFINENNDFETLFKLIMDGFDKMPEKSIKLESQYHYIYLTYEKNLGVISFQFYAEDKTTGVTGISQYMQKKQVMRLFGKAK